MKKKKFYYHNELSCKVSRTLKRRFMNICKDRDQTPDELMREVISDFVNEEIPKSSFHKAMYDIKAKIMRNRYILNYISTMLTFLLLGAVISGLMITREPDTPTILLVIIMSAVSLLLARMLFESGKRRKRSEVK